MKLQSKASKLVSQGAQDHQGPSNKNLQATRVSQGDPRQQATGGIKGPTAKS